MSEPTITFSSFPVVYPSYEPPRGVEYVPPTQEAIAQSYRTQWYRLSLGSTHYALRPQGLEHTDLWPAPINPTEELSSLFGRYLLTWWHVPGIPPSDDNRQALTTQLQQLLPPTADTQSVAVLGQHSQWIEPALLLECSRDQALALARSLEQGVIVQWTTQGAVIITVDGTRQDDLVPWTIHASTQAPCPMSRGPEVTLPVKRQGGPGTSRGHSVAAMWAHHARVAHSLVDCAVHPRGTPITAEPGRAISLYPLTVASRFATMTYLMEGK